LPFLCGVFLLPFKTSPNFGLYMQSTKIKTITQWPQSYCWKTT
jgi:hypothetical protein